MDGLECSEVLISKLERTMRMDSEFYSKENLQIENALQSCETTPVTDNFYVSDGNHMSVAEDFRDEGIPYYRGQDIYNIFIESSSPIHISDNYYNKENMKRSWLKKDDILLSIVGAIIGNTSMVYTEKKATCSCKLAIIRAKKQTSTPPFLNVFLKSKYGQNQIQKFRRGTAQTGLLLEDMDQIFVPTFGTEFNNHIKNIMERLHELIAKSDEIYQLAESTLLSALFLENFTPSKQNTSIKRFSDFTTSGRLDAEYYQAKYDEIEYRIKNNTCVTAYSILSDGNKNYEPIAKETYIYIELSNIDDYGGINDNCIIAKGKELPTRARRQVVTGDVIISSIEGSLGSCAIISNEYNHALCSTGFYIMSTDKINSETLLLLFKSYPIQMLMKRGCNGTILTAISVDELKRVFIPVPTKDIQQKISNKIKMSFTLREQSKSLLKSATKAVEMAIEEGEDTAIGYLEHILEQA